jgi:hypothetical protein
MAVLRGLSPGHSPAPTFIGAPEWSNYTVQADLMAERVGRKVGDVGLLNSGYTVDLMGAHQQIQVRSWDSELRASKEMPFAWSPESGTR